MAVPPPRAGTSQGAKAASGTGIGIGAGIGHEDIGLGPQIGGQGRRVFDRGRQADAPQAGGKAGEAHLVRFDPAKPADLARARRVDRRFTPRMPVEPREALYRGWQEAVARVRSQRPHPA